MPPVVLSPASSGIIKQPNVPLPSRVPERSGSQPSVPGGMPANDPVRRILSMGAEQAFTAAHERLTSLAQVKIDGTGDAAVKNAAAAAAALTETSMLLQQGHRKLDAMTSVSPELAANLMASSTQLAAIAPAVVSGAATGKFEHVAPRIAALIGAATDITGVALDAAQRATRAASTPSSAGYL